MKFVMNDDEGLVGEFPFGTLNISSNESLGYRPYQLLVSSIAGCSGGLLVRILGKMRIDIDNIELITDVERNENKPHTIDKVRLHFKIYGANLNDRRIEKAFVWTEKNCSIIQSVKGAIDVEKSYELINTAL